MKRHRSKNYQGCWWIDSKDPLGRKDRIYYCRYRIDGKPIDAKHGRRSDGKTWDTCKSYRRSLIDRREISTQEQRAKTKATILARTAHTLATIFKAYGLIEGKGSLVHSKQPSWKTSRSIYTVHLVPRFGEDKDLTTISHEDFNEFKEYLLTVRKPQTVKHILRLLKSLCGMVGNKLMGAYNTEAQFPTVKNQTTEDLTPAQLERLKEVLNSHPNRILSDMLMFVMTTGCRQGECLRLTQSDVDFRRKTIRLLDRKSSGGKDNDITIDMSTATEKILRRRIKDNMKMKGANKYIFPGKEGQKRFDSKRARAIMNTAGIQTSFRPCHGLRHWYANQLADAGVPIHVVCRMLGHASITTTERYFKARAETTVSAANIISNIMEM